jgi:hypothetical protein
MTPKHEPFCWLEKPKLRNIGDAFAEGKIGSLAAARSVYLALSEIASDRQSDTFIAATLYIAQRGGVTSKTVQRVTKILRRLGFLRMQGRSANGLKLANEYTLIRGNVSIGLIYPSLGKTRKTDLPTREELSEESTESTARKGKHSLSTDAKRNEQNEEDIVIHPSTGERYNKHTKEYVW